MRLIEALTKKRDAAKEAYLHWEHILTTLQHDPDLAKAINGRLDGKPAPEVGPAQERHRQMAVDHPLAQTIDPQLQAIAVRSVAARKGWKRRKVAKLWTPARRRKAALAMQARWKNPTVAPR